MENIQLPKYEMPEMSEMLTSLFGSADAGKKGAGGKNSKSVAKRKPQWGFGIFVWENIVSLDTKKNLIRLPYVFGYFVITDEDKSSVGRKKRKTRSSIHAKNEGKRKDRKTSLDIVNFAFLKIVN